MKKKNPGCAAAIAFGVFATACSLAVERWGAVTFWSILIAAFAMTVGLLRMGRLEAYRQGMRVWLPFLYGILVSFMGPALGLAFWQVILIAGIGGMLAWFLDDRVRPAPESPRDNAA